MNFSFLKLYFILFGLLDAIALVTDLYQSRADLANHLSLFTILNNTFTTIIFLYLGFRNTTKKTNNTAIDSTRGAVVIYMLITGILYNVFLASTLDAHAVQWINIIYHKLMPIIVFLSWILYPPLATIKIKTAFYWLIFPLAYLAYTLIRGSITGWYPYSFVNPVQNGYGSVFTFSLILLVVTFVASVLLILLGNWLLKSKIRILTT